MSGTARVDPMTKPRAEAPPRTTGGRERVLEAGGRLFALHGFPAVSAADIAREAGVSHGLLFHHFGSMEKLYVEVSRIAAARMDEMQLPAFDGGSSRRQITAFLRAHMRQVKRREADSIYRGRLADAALNTEITRIWEDSRRKAIDKVLVAVGVARPTRRITTCLRAWIGFHDQLVQGWLTDGTVTETEVVRLSLHQLDSLLQELLGRPLDDE